MMYTVEEILQAISILGPAERRRLLWELSETEKRKEGGTQLRLGEESVLSSGEPDYVLVFDGGSKGNPGLGYGSYALWRWGCEARQVRRLELGDNVTNNEAEYDTLIAGLKAVLREIAARKGKPAQYSLEVRGDSRLVIQQLQGLWKAKEERMRERRDQALELLHRFGGYRLVEAPRSEIVSILGH